MATALKEYFFLHYKIANRKLSDFGLNPLLGYSLVLTGFIGLSFYTFSKTEFAAYIYVLAALNFVHMLSEKRRNDFLKSCFQDKAYILVRLIENYSVILPFVVFLLFKLLWMPALISLAIASMLAFMNSDRGFNFTLPTPFYKKPFEFTVGFRSTFLLIAVAYFLTVMAVVAGNFNLGLFSLILLFFISLTFYANPENEYFVWSYKITPNQFLAEKIKTAVFYSTLLSIPVLATLCLFFFSDAGIILAFQLLGYVAIITLILAKYSAYPDPMNLPQVIIFVLTLQLPPILVVVIPFFYLQSVKRLNEIV